MYPPVLRMVGSTSEITPYSWGRRHIRPLIPTPGYASAAPPEGPLTMSSKEIAELTGKDHRNVMRDIRAMLEALGQDVLSFEQMSPDSYGRQQPVFNLPKDLTLTLVAGYNVTLRHRIVTRC